MFNSSAQLVRVRAHHFFVWLARVRVVSCAARFRAHPNTFVLALTRTSYFFASYISLARVRAHLERGPLALVRVRAHFSTVFFRSHASEPPCGLLPCRSFACERIVACQPRARTRASYGIVICIALVRVRAAPLSYHALSWFLPLFARMYAQKATAGLLNCLCMGPARSLR